MFIEKQLKILSLFNKLGEELDLSTLPKRIEQQKKIYLLQELGIDIGYSFRWHIYGPYSNALTTDYFQIQAIKRSYERTNISIKGINNFNENKISKAKSLFKQISSLPERAYPQYWWELISSIHFIKKSSRIVISDQQAVLILEKEKPGKFIKEDSVNATTILKEHNLI